ncbi:hypothetical protein ACTA71_002893 [Dictyostelium dimigraforme]
MVLVVIDLSKDLVDLIIFIKLVPSTTSNLSKGRGRKLKDFSCTLFPDVLLRFSDQEYVIISIISTYVVTLIGFAPILLHSKCVVFFEALSLTEMSFLNLNYRVAHIAYIEALLPTILTVSVKMDLTWTLNFPEFIELVQKV